MIYEVTQFGLPKNIAVGVTEALRQMQPGDTLHGRSLCGILPFVTPAPPMWSWR